MSMSIALIAVFVFCQSLCWPSRAGYAVRLHHRNGVVRFDSLNSFTQAADSCRVQSASDLAADRSIHASHGKAHIPGCDLPSLSNLTSIYSGMHPERPLCHCLRAEQKGLRSHHHRSVTTTHPERTDARLNRFRRQGARHFHGVAEMTDAERGYKGM